MSQVFVLDAAGRPPVPQNLQEKEWAKTVRSGALRRAMETLHQRRALLDEKDRSFACPHPRLVRSLGRGGVDFLLRW